LTGVSCPGNLRPDLVSATGESDPGMPNTPSDLLYTEDHEYVKKIDDATVQVGITDYAQGELGDVVYVELPKVGTALGRRDVFGTIEAVKAVSELYSPLAGTVTEVNSALEQDPALVNRDPYGAGWMIKLRAKNPAEFDELLGSEEYTKHIGG
jgi:glycine cleavage system H protein